MGKWFVLTVLFIYLQADIINHFRSVPNKSAAYSMPGIDFIYLINLDHKVEELKRTLDQLGHYEIHPCRFPAVDGGKLSLTEINSVGLRFSPFMQGGMVGISFDDYLPHPEIIAEFGKTYFSPEMRREAIGLALSHISILHDAFLSGYETIWVMEDGIEVVRDPRILNELIIKLDQAVQSWDILFTDCDMRPCHDMTLSRPDFIASKRGNSPRNDLEEFMQVEGKVGIYSMIIRRSGLNKLLKFFYTHSLFFPFEIEMLLQDLDLYAVREGIVVQK